MKLDQNVYLDIFEAEFESGSNLEKLVITLEETFINQCWWKLGQNVQFGNTYAVFELTSRSNKTRLPGTILEKPH